MLEKPSYTREVRVLEAVEMFADVSNFKQSVIDTSACAIARYEEYE